MTGIMWENYKMYSNYNITIKDSLTDTYYSNFVKKYHYKKSLPRGCKYNFCLFIGGKLAGVASYGVPNSKLYNGTHLELKRFTLSPNCIKNTATWFMAKCHKLLPKIDIISYAETSRHCGTIYKAANFKFIGETKKTQFIMMGGKNYTMRECYQKLNGKPTKLSKLVRKSLDNGSAKYTTGSSKNVFILKRG